MGAKGGVAGDPSPGGTPPPAPGWPAGPVLLTLFAAGSGLGLAHLDPMLAPLGWAGIGALAFALARARDAWPVIVGLALACAADQWIGHPWQLASAQIYGGGRVAVVVAIVIGHTAAVAGPKALALALGWRLARHAPAFVWLPLAWLAGEELRGALSRLSYDDWLNAQWQVTPVLRAVGWLGWLPAAWLCLAAAAGTADALARRAPRFLLVPLAAAVALGSLPARPPAPPGVLAGVGVVHMNSYFHPPRAAPPGVRLVVWPEQASALRPWLPEGAGAGKRVPPPFPAGTAAHLYGMLTRGPAGRQNAIVAVAPDGEVAAVRAKVGLFPLVERPVAGMWLPTACPIVAGAAPATLPTPLGTAVALVCLEGLERTYVEAEAKAAPDAQLLTLAASERVFGGSLLAMRQFVGAAALLAAVTGLPVARATLYGQAAIIDADGTVLAVSEPGTDGVLTVRGDVVHHRAPMAPLP